ncbi:hypothetical protein ABEF95_003172 [Exophiala dermatitidis]|uniref:Uncharacterized protein n=1 Tax=Exophiala dermatitidis (strain ATCC 34100 / CBS 525.76 / NIH/UT8656) TaxID=858893 RepID=H6BQ33_EXODN|nr:uncharacterized protein HMPREF1120_02647 [Exophiala dermatitidis NIH/UT8656]EHY54479.1 hypothetical protein HMPREF1120_02647 [Exophiala dermatitidis NIH/UT8656]
MRRVPASLSAMPSYRHDLLLWLRQGMEEAKVSEPASFDHGELVFVKVEMLTKFAYRTAEDLTATSRRLARYETLLNQIMPMVSPEVRALIEDAGETDGSNASNTSETPEIDFGVPPQRLDSGLVGPGGRIILPLPVPSPHVPVVSRSSTSSGTFEVVPGTTVGPPPSVPPPPSLPSGTPASSSNVSTSQRLSPDSIALTRLPSITSEGILLETGRAPDLSPPPTGPPPLLAQGQLVPDSTGSYGPERLGSLQALPSHTSLGGWSAESHSRRLNADSWTRDAAVATVLPWLTTS